MEGKLLLISVNAFGLTFDSKIYNPYSYNFICKTSVLLLTNMKTLLCNFLHWPWLRNQEWVPACHVLCP